MSSILFIARLLGKSHFPVFFITKGRKKREPYPKDRTLNSKSRPSPDHIVVSHQLQQPDLAKDTASLRINFHFSNFLLFHILFIILFSCASAVAQDLWNVDDFSLGDFSSGYKNDQLCPSYIYRKMILPLFRL